jgi:hypothetical protein
LKQIDVTGNLPYDTSPEDTFVAYTNRLGPFCSGDISWRVQTLTPAEYPISITIVEGGKSLWTSSFMPEPSGYRISESPIFECRGSDVFIIVANHNGASVLYSLQITISSK